MADMSTPDRRPPKRRRGIACTQCRDRKIRCDGTKPICDSCRRRNLPPDQCIYTDHDRGVGSVDNDYVKELEKRVHELEASSQHMNSPPTNLRPGFPPHGRRYSSSGIYQRPEYSIDVSQDHGKPSEACNDEDGNERDAEVALPLGESSISGFMKQAQETLQRRESSRATSSTTPGDQAKLLPTVASPSKRSSHKLGTWQTSFKDHRRLNATVATVMLPSRRLTDDLLQSFWDLEYTLMPMLHRPSFLQKYNQLWESVSAQDGPLDADSIYEKGSFYCLLCAILALVVRSTRPSRNSNGQRQELDITLLERSKLLLYSGLLEHGSIEVIQAILFISIYLRRAGSHHEAWIFIGLANRLAQGLGIHESIDEGSQAEREVRSRTYWGCVMMDNFHNIIFGQAPSSAALSIPLPNMIDDIYMETDPDKPDREQPPDVVPDISLYIFTTKLSDITAGVLRSIYNTSHGSLKDIPRAEFQTSMLALDAKLEAWLSSLPFHLRHENVATSGDDDRRRQSIMARVRYLDTKFLLFRAAILRLAGQDDLDLTTIQASIARGCRESCVDAVQELYYFCKKYQGTQFIPGPRHNVTCIMTAVTVLALILKSHFFARLARPEETEAQMRLMNDCMTLLKSYDRWHFPMKRKGAAEAVERLMQDNTGVTSSHDRIINYDRDGRQGHSNNNSAAAAPAPPSAETSSTTANNSNAAAVAPSYCLNFDSSRANIGNTPTSLLAPSSNSSAQQRAEPTNGMLLDTADFLGDLTGDLQNPDILLPYELDLFNSSAGFNVDFGAPGDMESGMFGGGADLEAAYYAPQEQQQQQQQQQQQVENAQGWWHPVKLR